MIPEGKEDKQTDHELCFLVPDVMMIIEVALLHVRRLEGVCSKKYYRTVDSGSSFGSKSTEEQLASSFKTSLAWKPSFSLCFCAS